MPSPKFTDAELEARAKELARYVIREIASAERLPLKKAQREAGWWTIESGAFHA
jgi:hypothetical protein